MKILDCTLRDGGYYTNWDFDRKLVKSYLSNFEEISIDYLEIGYRNPILDGYFGEYFYCKSETLNFIKSNTSKKLAIILDEKNVTVQNIDELLDPCKGIIDMVRIAIDPSNFDRAINLAKIIKQKGFEIAFNLMYMSNWDKFPNLIENFVQLNNLVNYLYLVDSFGGVFPDEVRSTIRKTRKATTVKLGFHGHNNLEMALANTLIAIEEGIDIIDATVTGMGRGAGNLKTELLLTTLDHKFGFDLNYDALSNITGKFQDLQQNYKWGTSLPYMVSGAKSLPQKQVMEWVNKRYYSMNSITRAINNKTVTNNFKNFDFDLNFDSVVIVGGGGSVFNHKKPILDFLNLNSNNIALIHSSSKNAKIFENIKNKQFFCLVGNEGIRLENVFKDLSKFQGKCILPPAPRTMGTYVPDLVVSNTYQLSEISFTNLNIDSHTAIALQTALLINAKTIYLVGYDGYIGEHISEHFQELFIENSKLFKDISNKLDCISLTESKYNDVIQSSIYKMIE